MEILSFEEVRIIGSLIEKEYTTPEYYPLTINSLTNACNQKSSRNPVVMYDEGLVENIVLKLRDKALVSKVTGPDLRVPKYRQLFSQKYNLTQAQTAIMCVLFLRGAQTIGEIRGRSYRIYEFKDLAETEETLEGLINIEESPFVIKLPKESGKENRHTHLFCGEPERAQPVKESNTEDRISLLEKEVNDLKEVVCILQAELKTLKDLFE
jgi:hypothetical protein